MSEYKRGNAFIAAFVVLLTCFFAPVYAQTGNVVLWNKLGSVNEVTHSEIGPNGTISGGSNAFEPAQFGSGYIRKATGNNMVTFPASVFSGVTRRGTIAIWVNPKVSRPQPYQYGIFGLVGCAYCGRNNNFTILWGDGVSGNGIWSEVNLGNNVNTNPNGPQYVATPGKPFHVASVWDINGIDGSTDTLRIYINGVLTGKTSNTWNPNVTPTTDIQLGFGPDGGGYDKFITDNIVIYDYAKTDFSDRFVENPVGKIFASFSPSVNLESGPKSSDYSFKLAAKFGLAADSNGIDPVTEKVTAKFGNYAVTIPAGSFQQQPSGAYAYAGTIDKVGLKANIQLAAGNTGTDYQFDLQATGANLDGTTLPPEAQLTIGDDTGKATLISSRATFGQGINAQVTTSGLVYSRATKTYLGTVYVKNTDTRDIPGPVSVVFKDLPAGVTLKNPSGTTQGNPYVVIPSLSSAADTFTQNQIVSFPVEFASTTATINFTPTVYSGSLNP